MPVEGEEEKAVEGVGQGAMFFGGRGEGEVRGLKSFDSLKLSLEL